MSCGVPCGLNCGNTLGIGFGYPSFASLGLGFYPGYFRDDICYGYGRVYGNTNGHGTIHNGFYDKGCCNSMYNLYYGPQRAPFREGWWWW